jgi:hypothetical protein
LPQPASIYSFQQVSQGLTGQAAKLGFGAKKGDEMFHLIAFLLFNG